MFTDMTMSYLDRLNKLLLIVDKRLKDHSEYSDSIHASTYACLLESTRLAYHIYHDSTLIPTHKKTRFKMLNEWITRMLLSLDNITVPLIKEKSDSTDCVAASSADADSDDWVPNPEIRAKRKSLVNLSLGIGTELGLLVTVTDSMTASSISSATNSNSSLLQHPWESSQSNSEVHKLLALANPHLNIPPS
jgi:hypothetical protein